MAPSFIWRSKSLSGAYKVTYKTRFYVHLGAFFKPFPATLQKTKKGFQTGFFLKLSKTIKKTEKNLISGYRKKAQKWDEIRFQNGLLSFLYLAIYEWWLLLIWHLPQCGCFGHFPWSSLELILGRRTYSSWGTLWLHNA